jgi:hypothetical protein
VNVTLPRVYQEAEKQLAHVGSDGSEVCFTPFFTGDLPAPEGSQQERECPRMQPRLALPPLFVRDGT